MAGIAMSTLVAQMCPNLRAPPRQSGCANMAATYSGRAHNCDFVPRNKTAVLDLSDGIKAGEIHLAAFLFGELRPQDERPVVELLADDGGTQPIGGGLQG